MKKLFYIFLVLFSIHVQAQYLLSSNTNIESCNKLDTCISANNFSFLYYDESKSEFFLKVDFSNFRAEGIVNNWIDKEKDTSLFFRMIFPKENFPVLGTEERKTFKVNGRIFYSNKWKDQPVEITVYSAQNSFLNNTSTSTNYTNNGFENYKLNFTIPFVPSDFKKYAQPYYNSQVLNINVTLGRINMLRPGMEPLLSEVYYQPSH